MSVLAGVGERWRVSELVCGYVAAPRYWSPATDDRRQWAARLVSGDRLGALRVGDVTPEVLRAAAARCLVDGGGVSTARAVHDVVRGAVSWAVSQGWLVADVLAGADGPRGCPVRRQASERSVRALVVAARQDLLRARRQYAATRSHAARLALFRAEQRLVLVMLVADTGLRRGELAGLRTDDLLGRQLWIERALKPVPGGTVVGPTKSHRHGRVAVSVATACSWRGHVRRWHGPDVVSGLRSTWLFTATPDAERPASPYTLASRFTTVCRQAGVEDATLHRVRHTVATSLARSGKLAQAQRRLRHRRLDTTLRHYVDTSGLNDQAVADELELLFGLGHPAG